MPVIAVGVALFLVLIAGIFVFSRSHPTEARGHLLSRQDPETWKSVAGNWRLWDLGEIWVSRRADKGLGDRRISAKFSLLVSQEFFESLEGELLLVLKSQVHDLIQSILDSREPDVRKDPASARQLLRDDVLRGLKMGANPNNPNLKTYQLPFNEENLLEVMVMELQEMRW